MNSRNLVTSDKGTELFPEVDEAGNVVGQMSRAEAHDGTKRLHPVVHLHVFNSEGELYLQHRAKWKSVQPDKWDTATGGHVDLGEDVMTALAREVYEEIGLASDCYIPKLAKTYIYANWCMSSRRNMTENFFLHLRRHREASSGLSATYAPP